MVPCTANMRKAKRSGIAGMGVCVDDVLASVRGVVDLSPHEALDEAQDFLIRQGYSLSYRTSTTLTVKRQVSDNATGQESIFELIVVALPQSGGGVRIKVRGNDREAVRDHQAAWLEWSETLPKRETEQPEAAATMESVTREIVGQEAPRPTTAADNDVPQRRYCSNGGHELADDDHFCPNCGNPVHETALVPTPEADRPVPPIPPAAERNTWERIRYGTLDAPPTQPPAAPRSGCLDRGEARVRHVHRTADHHFRADNRADNLYRGDWGERRLELDRGCGLPRTPLKRSSRGELTYPIAPALMLQVAGRGYGHSLRSANISLQQEGIHHRAYLSIGVTSSSGVGLCGMSEGVVSWGNGVWLCRISYMNFREFLFHAFR